MRVPLPLVLISLAFAGCAGSAPTQPTPAPIAPVAQLGAPVVQGDRVDAAMGLWHLSLDAGTLEYALEMIASRGAQQNDDLYWLDVERFFTSADLRIAAIAQTAQTIDLTWEARHPFAPPTVLDGPATAVNRADLGVAGHLVFLAEVPNAAEHSYFGGAIIANVDALTNADIVLHPDGLLEAGTTANAFPAQVLVDERGNGSRVGVSNGGSPTGNYGADGWTRDEMGANKDGWTGYGVLHQGQVTQRTVSFDKRVINRDGPIEIDLALIVRYNDPRNGATVEERIANRLPPATPDPLKFAYRMPHGALDASEVRTTVTGGGIIANDLDTSIDLSFAVVDWDANSPETTAADLSEDTDLSTVAVGESGNPIAQLSFPKILGPDAIFVDGDPGTPSGHPGDEVTLTVSFDNLTDSGQVPGLASGLLGIQDPEIAIDPPLALPLDSATLTPLTENLPLPITYGPVRLELGGGKWLNNFQSSTSTTFVYHQAVDPVTGVSYIAGAFSGMLDLDRGSGEDIRTSNGSRDCFLAAYDPYRTYLWGLTWGGIFEESVRSFSIAPDGSFRIGGTFSGTVDFDPGPGVEERTADAVLPSFVLALSPIGSFQWVVLVGETSIGSIEDAVVNGTGTTFLTGTFKDEIDLDPGPVEDIRSSNGSIDCFVSALDTDGSYLWGATWGSTEVDQSTALVVRADGGPAIVGNFSDTLDFDPGTGTEERTVVGANAGYLLDLSSVGDYLNVAVFDGAVASATSVDVVRIRPTDQAVYLGGTYRGIDVDLDPGPGMALHSTAGFETDGFIVALRNLRSFQWGVTVSSPVNDTINDLTITPNGALRIGGDLDGEHTVDFDPGPGTAEVNFLGGNDGWVWALDATGAYQWVRPFHHPGGSMTVEQVDVAPDGGLHVQGRYYGTADFDPDPVGELLLVGTGANLVSYAGKYRADGTWE